MTALSPVVPKPGLLNAVRGMKPTISIITINCNNARGLRQTVQSVTTQLTSACEYLIIDGQSDDGSPYVINEFSTAINYWASEPRLGVYNAMNKGIIQATGEYCLFLNSGDWLCPDSLGQAIAACTGEDIIYFNTYLSYAGKPLEKHCYPAELTMRSFFKRTIGHQSTLIKRELFNQHGLYNEQNKLYSDYEFWIQAIIHNNASCRHINRFLSCYDMSGMSAVPDEKATQELTAILDRNLPERVLADYTYWHTKEREMEILNWYKNQKGLYQVLVFIYKLIKNLERRVGVRR